jgi:hypothetical protein
MSSFIKLFTKLSNNLSLLFFTYGLSLVLSTVVYSIVEHETLFNSLWWACITSLTIGYGDISPHTVLGKVLTILLGHFWIFVIIPCIIANMITKVIVDRDIFTHEEQEQIKDDLIEIKQTICKVRGL